MRRMAWLGCLVLLLAPMVLGCSSEPEIDGKKVYEWISLFRHEDWAVQTQAHETVARLGEPALPYLKKNLVAEDPTMRRGAVITLGKMGESARKLVPNMLRRMRVEQVAVIRAEILKSLAVIDPKAEGVPEEFKKRLRDQASEVRDAAQAGLDMLKPPKPPEKKPEAKSDEAKVSDTFQLRKAVAAEIEKTGVAFAMIAEVVRDKMRAAIVWPAIKEGKIIDDDIVAYVFEQKNDKWELIKGNMLMSTSEGPNKLAEALGGADKQQVVRPCGLDREKISAHLEDRGKRFAEALAAGKADEAIKMFEELSRAFSFRLVAYDDMLAEMVINGAFAGPPWKIDTAGDSKKVKVELQVKGKTESGTIRLGSCGGGTVISGIEPEKEK